MICFSGLAQPAASKIEGNGVLPAGITNRPPTTNAPFGMVSIPAGSFSMRGTLGSDFFGDTPARTVRLSAFYMDKYEVTKALWDDVYSWATNHGFTFDNVGCWDRKGIHSKGTNHPVHTINWYDCVKWCNARSLKAGKLPAYYTDAALTVVYKTDRAKPYVNWNRGYRLPTEAEWEKAARGGLSGKQFPWGDTITHKQANYFSYWDGGKPEFFFDVNPAGGDHPSYESGGYPHTSPVGSFAANGYGLYDMAGNVSEWCWHWYTTNRAVAQSDPRGPVLGEYRVLRGGSWPANAGFCLVGRSEFDGPMRSDQTIGFRCGLPPTE
jgi:formylglycine-generating enzyme required for sulfatase activity